MSTTRPARVAAEARRLSFAAAAPADGVRIGGAGATRTGRVVPLDGVLYVECRCGLAHRLPGTDTWKLCDCGRAFRVRAHVEIIETAEEWARSQP